MTFHSVVDRFMAHALERPDRPALFAGSRSLSYGELRDAVLTFSQILHDSAGHTLALQLENSIAWVVADLAALNAGVTVVPVPVFFSPTQVAHLLSSASADLLLIPTGVRPGAEWDALEEVSQGATLFRRVAPKLAHGAKVTYTSGSSGEPKGVVLLGTTIDATTDGIVQALTPLNPERHLCMLPLATLLENIAGLYAPLCIGSAIELPTAEQTGLGAASLDIERFGQLLSSSKADTLILVPQLLTAMLTLCELGILDAAHFTFIAVGGGRISRSLLERAAAMHLPVFEGYGLSECCSVLSLNLPGHARPGSVGKLLQHASLRVVHTGEIEVRQPLMEGYLGEPTNKERWYRTGDLGHLDEDGFLFIDGRKRNVFITSYGRNVNPEWMESALTQQVAIEQALAYGEAQPTNLALLWLRFAQTPEQLDAVIRRVNNELPDYAKVHNYRVMEGAPPPDLLTANSRLKRDLALERYHDVIGAHYTNHTSTLHKEHQHAVL